MKAYIVSGSPGGTDDINGIYTLVTETGIALANHLCSDKSYAKGDLYADRPERIAEYTERFGELEVLFLGEDDMTNEELLDRHHKAQALAEMEEEQ